MTTNEKAPAGKLGASSNISATRNITGPKEATGLDHGHGVPEQRIDASHAHTAATDQLSGLKAAEYWLDFLYGSQPSGLIWIGYFPSGGGCKGRTFTNPTEAAQYAMELDAQGHKGVYHRLTTLKSTPESGRGKSTDSAVMPALGLDLDLKGPNHKKDDLPETEEDLKLLLEKAGLPEPTAWVHSGGGRYPYWQFEGPLNVRSDSAYERIKALSEGWHQHVIEWGKTFGWKLDNTRDLARVYRLPGTTNRKAGPVTCHVITDAGSVYLPEELEAALKAAPTPPAPPGADPFINPPTKEEARQERAENGSTPGEGRRIMKRARATSKVNQALNSVRNAIEGERNTTLNNAAVYLGHFVGSLFSRFDAESRLREAGQACGLPPEEVDATLASGLRKGMEELWEVTEPKEKPLPKEGDLVFTDAMLAELVGKECLAGRFCQTSSMGWLAWNGVHWEKVERGTVTESVRQYVVKRYTDALEAERQRVKRGEKSDQTEIDEWYKIQSAQRISAILSLAGNIEGVLRDGTDFDTHHDLLNTPSGVLDLRTGELEPHDPDLLITKVTTVAYKPEATHAAWATALEAVPADSVGWLQVRLGQALTGYSTDDERMVLLSGGGSNGKTTLMDTAFKALGTYAAAVPNTLLLMGKQAGAATPEKMTLRGVRLAYIEETPEDRHLDVNALKQVVGTPTINGRALYKDFLEFGATHSLFLNTNYPPRVVETDHGTWRRLARIDFPYRFVAPSTELEKEGDRHGDPMLKAKLRSKAAREAALAWMVEGAMRWYRASETLTAFPDSPTVQESTRSWRHESDLILRYLDECMDFHRDSFVTSADLYAHFVRWTQAMNHKDIPQTTFISRLKGHTALPAFVVAKQVVLATTPAQRSRPGNPFNTPKSDPGEPARPWCIVGLRYK